MIGDSWEYDSFVCINCQKIEKSFEVLVVDDGSNKMSKDALETMKDWFQIYESFTTTKTRAMEVLYGLDLKITGQANFLYRR